MERRAFIIRGGKSLGAISLGVMGIYSCQSHEAGIFNGAFSLAEVNMINEIGEIIIPITDTPGAKAAGVGEFIAVVVQDCFSEKEKKEFKATLEDINSVCNESFGYGFLKCKANERLTLVSKMEEGHGGYKKLKNLIVSAYLSSETGMTKYFDYHPVPGKYDGCTAVRPW